MRKYQDLWLDQSDWKGGLLKNQEFRKKCFIGGGEKGEQVQIETAYKEIQFCGCIRKNGKYFLAVKIASHPSHYFYLV